MHCVSHLALGGAERAALTLIGALENDFEFSVYAVRGLADGPVGLALEGELRTRRVPLHVGWRIPMRCGGILSGAIGLRQALHRFAPELIHLHTEIPEASYAALACSLPALRRIPLVRTIHNAVYWEFWRPLGRWSDRRMQRSYCAGVSADATGAAQRLRQESDAGAFPVKPKVIYNAVLPPAPVPRVKRSDPNLVRVVFGGRFEFEKGADLLPALLENARPPTGRTAQLTIHGSGTGERRLRALADAPPPGWTVTVQPPDPNFRARLAEADIALVPSRAEGFGLVAVEAFLADVPVIATRAAGLRETIPPGYPWLAEPGDVKSLAAVLQAALAASQEERAAIAATGRTFAQQHFIVSKMADGYRSLYAQALSGSDAPSPRATLVS